MCTQCFNKKQFAVSRDPTWESWFRIWVSAPVRSEGTASGTSIGADGKEEFNINRTQTTQENNDNGMRREQQIHDGVVCEDTGWGNSRAVFTTNLLYP